MPTDTALLYGLVWYAVFLFSTTLHEASHAFAALKLGDDTAYRGGQVTLDPTPHIRREPFGMVIVPILSYLLSIARGGAGWMIGWASAPYDPHWANRYPRRAGLMALAGPVSNLALFLISAILIRIGVIIGFFEAPDSVRFGHITDAVSNQKFMQLLAMFVSIGFSLNLLLFLFNLLPLPPLDGSSVPLIFLSEEAADKYWGFLRNPAMTLVGMVIAWNIFGPISSPLHLLAINLLYFPGHSYG